MPQGMSELTVGELSRERGDEQSGAGPIGRYLCNLEYRDRPYRVPGVADRLDEPACFQPAREDVRSA